MRPHLVGITRLAPLLLFLAAPAAAAADGTVAGLVSSAGRGVGDVAVEVYLEKKKDVGGTPFALTRSGDDGRFSIALPPGDFYLWAREEAPLFGPPRVTEYEGNPVTVVSGKKTLLDDLELKEVGGRAAAAPGTGVRGRAVVAGAPAADVSVMMYDGATAQLTGPGYAAMAVTGTDGHFETDLAPGRYRVALRKRRGGGLGGFLGPGDQSGEYEANPVTVVAGAYLDLGDVALHEVDPARLAREEEARRRGEGTGALSGAVTGTNGKPLAGQYVFLYRDGGMIGRPDAVAVTADDGSFRFGITGRGTWYLGARSSMGGPRQPGEMVGRLAGSTDSSVTVTEGENRKGLAIVMEALW